MIKWLLFQVTDFQDDLLHSHRSLEHTLSLLLRRARGAKGSHVVGWALASRGSVQAEAGRRHGVCPWGLARALAPEHFYRKTHPAASSSLCNCLGNRPRSPTGHRARPYLPHELLLAHSNPLSLHLDPLEPQLLLLLLLSGQRIGHAQEPGRGARRGVGLLAQGTGRHLLLVLVIHHCGGGTQRSVATPHRKETRAHTHNGAVRSCKRERSLILRDDTEGPGE